MSGTLSLDPMLEARSVAVVGASERPGSVGDQTLRQLLGGGFAGDVHPVNPRYRSLHGLECHPSLDDLPGPADLAVLAVANARLEAEMEKAVGAGARSIAIYASCHGPSTTGEPLRQRLAGLANEAGVPICGGNGMGFLNVEGGLRVCGFYQPPELVPGGTTFLSHSGSLFSAMLHNTRGLRFNLVVSTGLELNTTMDAYMRWALKRESTRVIALFLETIRDPDGFRAALLEAARLDIPVVALKVGSSLRGREAVATHSEALAGDDAVYEALFEAHGVHRVWSMDEMADTIDVLVAGRRASAPGLGAVHDSGGERALLIDTADRVGVPLPTLGDDATKRLEAVLDPGLEAANPVDAWGTGRDATDVFVECLLALAEDDAVGAVAFCVDLTPEERPDDAYSAAALAAAGRTEKPVVVLANMSSTVDPAQAARLREGGIPVLHGTETGLRAIGHLIDRSLRRSEARPSRLTGVGDPGRGLAGETEALDVLEAYGIPTPRRRIVDSEAELPGAASEVGFPLVLKTASGQSHKTESRGVVLGIGDEGSLVAAYRDMSARLGPRALLSTQVESGVEVGLGMITDSQFGPVVIVSAGGTLIETLGDRVALLPPVDTDRAGWALNRLSLRPLLDGFRGGVAVDMDALAEVVVRFSELAVDADGAVGSIDVNPVIAGPGGAVAVDALFTPASASHETAAETRESGR